MSWQKVRLGSLVKVKGGKRLPKGSKYSENVTAHPYIRVTDFENNSVGLTDLVYIEPEIQEKIARYTISSDDVFISIAGTIGIVGIIPNELDGANLTENAAKLIINDATQLDKRYLMRFLSTAGQSEIHQRKKTTSQPKLALFRIEEIEIPLPPLDEQKRIAAILDKADAIRRKRQQAIDLADDFLSSVFLDMFGDPVTNPKGWETKPLKLLCDVKGGGTPSKSNETYWGGDIPWVSPKDMKSLYISSSKDKITSEAIKGSSTKLIDTDSVLMVVRSGVLKHTVPLALTTKPVSINQDMKAFSCRSDLNPHYLLFCLKAFSQFLLGTVRGTTADNLSSDVINNLSVPVPSIEMQEKFASIALKQQSTKIKNQNSNNLSLLSFNSLSQQAFSGEL